MKAVVYRKTKGLVVEDVPTPKIGSDQVLVQVADAGFCGSDHSIVKYDYVPDGHILGHEVSGTVVEVGVDAGGCSAGDRVTVRPTYCGKCRQCLEGRTPLCTVHRRSIGTGDMQGGFAEYLVAYPQMLIPVPDGADSRNAAIAEMFATSLHAINSSGVSGGAALVLGGGPIGLALVKLLQIRGFGPVVLSEPVDAKRAIGTAYGADATLDPFEEDLPAAAKAATGGQGFDVVFECAGVAANIQTGIDCSAPGGVVSVVSVILGEASIKPVSLNLNREIRLTGSWSSSHEENRQCLEWMADGSLDGTPLISDLITLDELPEAYAERIHPGKIVKLVISIGEEF
jgi:(R,R)-butanediol dehydrogenase/meso-butanediol dehydrogenase/diacetyl reductase